MPDIIDCDSRWGGAKSAYIPIDRARVTKEEIPGPIGFIGIDSPRIPYSFENLANLGFSRRYPREIGILDSAVPSSSEGTTQKRQ